MLARGCHPMQLHRHRAHLHNLPQATSNVPLQQIMYHTQVNRLEAQRLHLPRVHPRCHPRGGQGIFSAYAAKDTTTYAKTAQSHV
jgi:hypothetical protein